MSELFYPSMVVHFTVRLDASFQLLGADEQPATPSSGSTGSGARLQPLVLPGSKNASRVMNRVPKSASVEIPGYRSAGSFTLTLPFRELPIDPRLVRACGVEIHLGAVPAAQAGAGFRGRRADGDPARYASTLETWSPRASSMRERFFAAYDDTLLMEGTADTWAVHHGEDGSSVTISGRDTRAMFLDAKVPPKLIAEIDLARPVHLVVADILRTAPSEMDLGVDVFCNPLDFPGGVVPMPFDKAGQLRVRSGTDGGGYSTPGGGASGKLSYWDLITKYCFLCGAIPFLRGSTLRIVPSRSLYQQLGTSQVKGADGEVIDVRTPFRGGAAREVDGEQMRVRRLVYGRDVKSLGYERKYGATAVPAVRAVAIDDTKRGQEKLLEVQWPPAQSKQEAFAGEPIWIPVPGVTDPARLLDIARDAYEEAGRGEVGGACETSRLASFGGDNADPDMVRLRPGDAVELLVDARALSGRSPLVAELTDHERRPFDEEVAVVAERIGDATMARAIVATARSYVVQSLRWFRVSTARYNWEASSGVAIAFDFQTYVVASHAEHDEASGKPPPANAAKVEKVRKRGKQRGTAANTNAKRAERRS